MRLPGALIALLVAEAFFAHATLNSILKPFQSLLGWKNAVNSSKNGETRTEDRVAVGGRLKIDRSTPIVASNLMTPKLDGKVAKERPAFAKDFDPTALSEPPKASSPFDSPHRVTFASSLATTTTSSSGHSTSVTSPTNPTTSVSRVSAPTTGANNFHMVDLKIPGGESPDSGTLPDVASFEPNRPSESTDTNQKEPSVSVDAGSKVSETLSTTTNQGILPAPVMIPVSTTTPAPSTPTTTTTMTTTVAAVTDAFRGTTPSSRSAARESARESNRFQTIKHPERSFVFQDVNDLFQSDD